MVLGDKLLLRKLSNTQINTFKGLPEIAMGLQIASANDNLAFIVGGQVAIIPNEKDSKIDKSLLRIFKKWSGMSLEASRSDFEVWRNDLAKAPELKHLEADRIELALVFKPVGPQASLPKPPPVIYGHLPFAKRTQANEIYYRCEPWPKSVRIQQNIKRILAHTFACPGSEVPFLTSGFATVGRYALPNLMPHCYRWELQPVAGAMLDCGASVPLYGQAGGGVEVRFRNVTANSGPIANPMTLPPL